MHAAEAGDVVKPMRCRESRRGRVDWNANQGRCKTHPYLAVARLLRIKFDRLVVVLPEAVEIGVKREKKNVPSWVKRRESVEIRRKESDIPCRLGDS